MLFCTGKSPTVGIKRVIIFEISDFFNFTIGSRQKQKVRFSAKLPGEFDFIVALRHSTGLVGLNDQINLSFFITPLTDYGIFELFAAAGNQRDGRV